MYARTRRVRILIIHKPNPIFTCSTQNLGSGKNLYSFPRSTQGVPRTSCLKLKSKKNLQFLLAQSKAFFSEIMHTVTNQKSQGQVLSREYLSSLVVKQTGGSAAQPEHIWKCHGQVLMKCLIPVTQLKKACVFHIKCFPTITCLYVSFPLCDRKLPYIKVLKIGKCPGPVFLTSAVLFPRASKVRYLQPGQLPVSSKERSQSQDQPGSQSVCLKPCHFYGCNLRATWLSGKQPKTN